MAEKTRSTVAVDVGRVDTKCSSLSTKGYISVLLVVTKSGEDIQIWMNRNINHIMLQLMLQMIFLLLRKLFRIEFLDQITNMLHIEWLITISKIRGCTQNEKLCRLFTKSVVQLLQLLIYGSCKYFYSVMMCRLEGLLLKRHLWVQWSFFAWKMDCRCFWSSIFPTRQLSTS